MPEFQNDIMTMALSHDVHNHKHVDNLINNSPVKMSDREICDKYNKKHYVDPNMHGIEQNNSKLMTRSDALNKYASKGISKTINAETKYNKQKASINLKIANAKVALKADKFAKSIGAKPPFDDTKLQKTNLANQKQLKSLKATFDKNSQMGKQDLKMAQGIKHSFGRFISIDNNGNARAATAKQLREVVPNVHDVKVKMDDTQKSKDSVDKYLQNKDTKFTDPIDASKPIMKVTNAFSELNYKYSNDKTLNKLDAKDGMKLKHCVTLADLHGTGTGVNGNVDDKYAPEIKQSYMKHVNAYQAKGQNPSDYIYLMPEKDNSSKFRPVTPDEVNQSAEVASKQLGKSIEEDKQKIAQFGHHHSQEQSQSVKQPTINKPRHVNQTSSTQHHKIQHAEQESLFKTPNPTAMKKAKIQRSQGMQR